MAQFNQLRGRVWAGVVFCGVAFGGCSGSSAGPVAPAPPPPPPAAAKLAFSGQPSNAVAGAANTPAVQVAVQDAQGNTVTTATTSITVAIGTNPASGTLAGTTTVAAVNGVATFSTLSLNRAAAGYTLTASAASLVSATSSAFNISAAAAAKLVFTVQPSNAAAGAASTPAVQVAVQDALGNTVTTSTSSITMAIGTNPASGTLSGTMTVAAISGVATFSTLILNRAGTGYTLTASATGLTGATSSAFSIGVGAAAKLVFTLQPSNAVAGAANTPAVQVTVQDAQGNTVTTANTSITVAIGTNPASGVLSGTMTVAAISGVATFSTLSLNRTGTGYTLTASATGLTGATSSAFSISPGAAAKIAFTVQPSDAAAGAGITPAMQVAVQDAQGNPVTTATTSITLAIGTNPASGALTGTTTVAAVSGVATFSTLSVNRAATGYTLTAAATGLTGATSSAFTISPGAAAKLLFTVQPSNEVAGLAMTPAVQVAVSDDQGNTVTTATTSITLAIAANPASGTLSGTTTVAAVNGIATFANVSIDNPGIGYALNASATSLTGATSNSFNTGLALVQVSSGEGSFVCGVTAAQAAYCWDYNGYGQLGNGTLTSSTTPVAVSGGLKFATVNAGIFATCGVTTAGAAYCWGHNGVGELGNGTTLNSLAPVAVSGGLTFASVSGGGNFSNFTCGVTTVGAAYCWGANGAGQLGNGTLTSSTTPVALSGGLTFATVSAGGQAFACGVTTGGAAYCWGANTNGQLGNGTTTASSTPVAVSGGHTFASVDAGFYGACGVTTAGAGYCWGANPVGQFGNGTRISSPTPVAVSGGLIFKTVSAAWGAFTCGVTTAQVAYCWGDNIYGELGNGTLNSSLTPMAVFGGLAFTAVSGGAQGACGVTAAGGAYCWGGNTQGELGNGTLTSSTTPVVVW